MLSSGVCAPRRRSQPQRAAQAKGQRTTDFYLALHCGDLLFGNFGSTNRLDFTVLGQRSMRRAASAACAARWISG
jgi:adenylate cyclase